MKNLRCDKALTFDYVKKSLFSIKASNLLLIFQIDGVFVTSIFLRYYVYTEQILTLSI